MLAPWVGPRIVALINTLVNWLCASERAHRRRKEAVFETEPVGENVNFSSKLTT